MDKKIGLIGTMTPPNIGLMEFIDKTHHQIPTVVTDKDFKPSTLQEAVGDLNKALDLFKKAVQDAFLEDRSKHRDAILKRFLNKNKK